MGCSGLLILVLVLNVAHGLKVLDMDEKSGLVSHITVVLGEDMYLSCRFWGEGQLVSAEWKHRIPPKTIRLAGFVNDKPFSREGFSKPESPSNLTVQKKVHSVDVEGEYICEFKTEELEIQGSVFVTVEARPDIQIQVNADIINGTHYQFVSCSAIGGKPQPQISWLINNLPPPDDLFTVEMNDTLHSDGTSTLNSTLSFPTHLQDDDSVTCVVQHSTLPNRTLITARVQTYTKPNVTIKPEMIQQEGNDFWVVSCISSGGRPDTVMSLALSTTEDLHRVHKTDSDVQELSVRFPVTEYEGHNVTCVFDHPKFTHTESRVLTLPTWYLSGAQLDSELGNDFPATELLDLQEGQSDAVISFEVTGNVPRYNVICKKDRGPLPDGVELVDRSLTVQGPVEHRHAGLYKCVFSYQHLQATQQINVTVKPRVVQLVPPTIRVDLRAEGGRSVIECSAADAVPAANVSWRLAEGVSGDFWLNSTSHNGSHSVRGVLLLPACSHRELTAECVINHPAFEEPENRSITLPLCAPPDITLNASTEWKDGHMYTKVDCSVDSVAPTAAITWNVGNTDGNISYHTQREVQADGPVSARSSVHFLSSLYAGQNLTCTVKHPSLKAPEKRTIHIPVHKPPQLSVSVVRQRDSSLWLAVCDCRGEGVGTNLAWLLPENAKSQTSLHSEYEGHILKARLTYEFPLELYEGQNLTCLYQFEHGIKEERTVHIPRYYISSVTILNHTTPLQSRYTDQPVTYRLSLNDNHHPQKILLRVEGNMPDYRLNCQRSDGSFAQMDGAAMILQDGGLYTCWASFYHHRAAVSIHVEVMTSEEQFALVAMICVSSALAIVLMLVVLLCVCCKENSRTQYKEQESLSALTALVPGSPEVKKPEESKQYADLVSYSIVIDVKSTV